MKQLLQIASALPDVEQGIACAGTSLESRTFHVKGKAFLFISREHARLKLAASADEARGHGADVGTGGWTKLSLDALPPPAVLKRWIAESHGLVGGGKARGAAKSPVSAATSPAKRAAKRARPSSAARARSTRRAGIG